MQISVYGRQFNPHFNDYAKRLFTRLRENSLRISLYEPFYNFLVREAGIDPEPETIFNSHNDLDRSSDFIFTIGGDGTILETIALVRDTGIPVLGFNSGKLGFLANISGNDIDEAIEAVMTGNYTTEKRSLLQLQSPGKVFSGFDCALNEFTVQKKDSTMITIQAWLNDHLLNSYWADGLIISTPTGSTAYSLSAGGPLLTPDTGAIIISPIAPHNLTVRPVVVPDNNTIRLRVTGNRPKFLLSMDSRSTLVAMETEIVIRRPGYYINLIRLNSQDFYATLRNKLMWGADKRN